MPRLKFLLVIVVIFINCITVNAKLTVAFVESKDFYSGIVAGPKTDAKIINALIDVFGEEWYKDRLCSSPGIFTLWIGKGNQIIVGGTSMSDKDLLMRVKIALDYLSAKGDTLYDYEKKPNDLSSIINSFKDKRIFVGQPYREDLEFAEIWICIHTLPLEDGYEKECIEEGCMTLNHRIISDLLNKGESIPQKDFELYYKWFIKACDSFLTKELELPLKATEFYYEYDENSQLRYIEQELM